MLFMQADKIVLTTKIRVNVMHFCHVHFIFYMYPIKTEKKITKSIA